VVEEGRAYVHFGTFGIACLDSETGEVLWWRTDLNCDPIQGPVSSPVLFDDLLIVHLEGTDVQFIAALDKKTGNTVWRTDRPQAIYGNVEPLYFRKAFQTPVIVEVDGKAQLVGNGSQVAMDHDPRTAMTSCLRRRQQQHHLSNRQRPWALLRQLRRNLE